MTEALARLSPDAAARVTTYEADSSTLDAAAIVPRPHLCLIDGEHTDAALRRDFEFCRAVMPDGGLVLCHDTPVVYNGLAAIVDALDAAGTPYSAAVLPDTLLAIDIGPTGVLDSPPLAAVRAASFRGTLFSLQANDHYRTFANRWPWGTRRRLRSRRAAAR